MQLRYDVYDTVILIISFIALNGAMLIIFTKGLKTLQKTFFILIIFLLFTLIVNEISNNKKDNIELRNQRDKIQKDYFKHQIEIEKSRSEILRLLEKNK